MLLSRLHAIAAQEARDRSTSIFGMRAVDLISPARGVLWVQLKYGSLVVSCNGLEVWVAWLRTLAEAGVRYGLEVSRIRGLDK